MNNEQDAMQTLCDQLGVQDYYEAIRLWHSFYCFNVPRRSEIAQPVERSTDVEVRV